MSHELLPGNVGTCLGHHARACDRIGGLGVAVNGIIADHYSLAAALGTIPIPIAFAILLMIVLPYRGRHLGRNTLPYPPGKTRYHYMVGFRNEIIEA